MALFDAQKMRERFEIFKKIDSTTYPFSFAEFWRRKIRLENQVDHILSERHIHVTYGKLSQTLKAWQWNRPYEFAKFAPGLRTALANMGESYNAVRNYSLLDFHKVPQNHLELIWNELGAVKELGKNDYGLYFVMAATKPLMFLWGQTLAFDSVVRRLMPRFEMTGLGSCNWTFKTWKAVMTRFSEAVGDELELVDIMKELSLKEYGTDSMVPYGQFMDMYYWASDRKRECTN
jgi:hypothetical protein